MLRVRQLAASLLDQVLHQQQHAKGWGPAPAGGAYTWHCLQTRLMPNSATASCGIQTRGVKKQAATNKEVKVVLLQDVFRFGKKGEVKSARAGWVRHHLFPRGAALYATPGNVARFAQVETAQAQTEDDSLRQMEKQMLSMLRTLAHRAVNISRKAAGTPQASEAKATAELDDQRAGPQQQQQDGMNAEEEAGMQGTVTNYDVRQAVLRQLGIQLHESHVLMETPINVFGTFKVPLNLRMLDDHQVELTLHVNRVKHIRHGQASV